MTGVLRIVHVHEPVTWTVGLCAVHRDRVTSQAIDQPIVGTITWTPRHDWKTDGAAA